MPRSPYYPSGSVWTINCSQLNQIATACHSGTAFGRRHPGATVFDSGAIYDRPSLPRTLATIGGASICSMLALELPSNHELWKMQAGPALLELLLIFCFLCLLFYLPHRRKTPAIVGIVALASIGIAEYFVITFKSMPIQPGDLFALSTAATVAGSYTYELSTFCFMGLAAAALGIALIVLIPRDACGRPPRRASETSPSPSTMRCLRP